MTDLKFIKSGGAELILAPSLGGGIARLDVYGRPLLRPWQGNEKKVFSLASNILIPFSNRISRGGFMWKGMKYTLKPNFKNEIYPIHGDGLYRKWKFISSEKNKTKMSLLKGGIGPWVYSAIQEFYLSSSQLKITLSVTNKGTHSLPFGCGFHPWFPRTQDTKLAFGAKRVWLEDSEHLPSKELYLTKHSSWQFRNLRSLPSSWINNCYSEWDGKVLIKQGDDSVSCLITASKNLSHAIVYSPDAASNFFCFEPASHSIDALNLPHQPGLKELKVDETLKASITISW